MTREIQLTQNKVALVDDEDYEHLSQFKWYVTTSRNTCYVYSMSVLNKHITSVAMHRLIMNAQKGEFVDHINHNGLDNRKCNLRICTHIENLRNQILIKRNTSGYKGVSWNPTINEWQSQIKISNKILYLGIFTDIIQAAYAYDEAALYHFKEFACLNFPDLTSEDRNCSEDTIRRIHLHSSNFRSNNSGYRGVSWDNRSKLWRCVISVNNKTVHLGYSNSKIVCALVYDENAVKYHGDKAYLNFPMYI